MGYFAYDFLHHARDRKPANIAEAGRIEEAVVQRFVWFQGPAGTTVQFIIAAVIVVVGSRLLVDAAVNIAKAMGIPSILVGLTVVASGTSLPELITAVSSARKNVSDLAVGNVLGANIANLTFIVGTAAVQTEVTMARTTQVINFVALLVVFGMLLWMMLNDRRISRKEGVALLLTYSLISVRSCFLPSASSGNVPVLSSRRMLIGGVSPLQECGPVRLALRG